MKKLSKAQIKLLRIMAEGAKVYWFRGLHSRCYLSHSHRSLNYKTVFALKDRGLIEDIEPIEIRWRLSTFVITDAGRALLEEE